MPVSRFFPRSSQRPTETPAAARAEPGAPRAAEAGVPDVAPDAPRQAALPKSRFAPLNALIGKAQAAVRSVARSTPAVAGVLLALTMGFSAPAMAQTHQPAVGAPVQVVAAAQVEAAVDADPLVYVVQKRDRLEDIAEALDTTVDEIMALNRDVIRYRDLIHPGDALELPADVDSAALAALQGTPHPTVSHADDAKPHVNAPDLYTVRSGDNLGRISHRTGVSVDALVELNGIERPSHIEPGWILKLRETPTVRPQARPDTSGQPQAQTEAPEVTTPIVTAPEITTPQISTPDAARPDTTRPELTTPAQPDTSDATARPDAAARGPLAHLSAADQQVFTVDQPFLMWGADGHAVELVQQRLADLGFPLGTVDGDFGGKTRSAVRVFQAMNGLETDGKVGGATWRTLASADAVGLPTDGSYPVQEVYRPYSRDAYQLFLRAAADEGLPLDWAIADSLHKLIDAESDGEVGRPNYTYGWRANATGQWDDIHAELQRGRITARSSATGIGQLLLSNVEAHYPSGRAGINVPLEEARGMLSYIEDRHGTPDNAWRRYNSVHEGY